VFLSSASNEQIELRIERPSPSQLRLVVLSLEDAPESGEFIARSAEWSTDVIALEKRIEIDLPELPQGAEVSVSLYDSFGKLQGVPRRIALPGTVNSVRISPPPKGASLQSRPEPPTPASGRSTAVIAFFSGVAVLAAWSLFAVSSRPVSPSATEQASQPTPFGKPPRDEVAKSTAPTPQPAAPTHSVATERANLRSKPQVGRNALLTELPLNTEVTLLGEEGDFLQVKLESGVTGFVHKDVVVPVEVARRLRFLTPEKLESDFLVTELEKVVDLALIHVKGIHLGAPATYLDQQLAELEKVNRSSIKLNSDAARYLAYRAKSAITDGSPAFAESLYRAAIRADPLHVDSIVGLGAMLLKQGAAIPLPFAVHSVFVAPRSAMPWILLAAGLSAGNADRLVPLSLDIAFRYSKDVPTTRKFLAEVAAASQSEWFKTEAENALRRAS
jgi:hypothetical protein